MVRGTGAASGRRNDRGAGALEYGALVAVAAMVVGILFTAVPGVAQPGIKNAVCDLFGGECADQSGGDGGDGDGSEQGGDEREPAAHAPCAVSTVERNSIRQTLLGIDTTTEGETHTVQIFSDGGAMLKEGTVHGSGTSIGFSFNLPKGAGGSVQLSSGEITEQGDILYFPTGEDRDRYIAYRRALQDLERKVFTGEVTREQMLAMQSSLSAFRAGMIQSQYTKVGHEGTVKIAGSLFGASTAAELGIGSSSVVEYNGDAGETTTTFQVDAKALGQLGIIVAGEAHGQVDGQVSLSVTTDKQGRPKSLKIGGQMAFQGQVNGLNGDLGGVTDYAPTGKMGRLGGLIDAAAVSVGVTHTEDPRGMLQVELGLDLTDPRNRAAFESFLKNPGDPDALLTQLGDRGTLDLRAYEGTSEKEGAEFGIQAVFGIGAKAENTTTTMTLTDAYTMNGQGLRRRTDCLK